MTMNNRGSKTRPLKLLALVLFLLSLVAALIPISSLKINNSLEIWFYAGDTQLGAYDRGHRLFGDWDWMSIYVQPRDGQYDEAALRGLKELTRRLETLPNVRKVISVANARGNLLAQDELSYQSILGNPPWTAERIRDVRGTLDSNLVYRNGLIKPGSDKDSLIMLQVRNRGGETDAYRIALVDSVSALLDEHKGILTSRAMAGTPYLNAELNRSSRHDMYLFYPLVTGLVMLMAWFSFRNFRDVAITLATLSGVTMWSVGLMMTRFELNMVTIMMPTILITVSVANIMHMIVTFHQLRREHSDWSAERAVKTAMKELWVPSLGAATTTAVGFLSLTQTDILPINLLGYFSALGILFALFLTFTLLPLLLVMCWSGAERTQRPATTGKGQMYHISWMAVVSKTSLSHPWKMLALFAAISAVVCSSIPRLDADTSYVDMFNKTTLVKNYYDRIKGSGYATNSLTLLIHAPAGLEDEHSFRAVHALEQKIESLPETRTVLGPVKLIAEVDRALAVDKSAWKPDFSGYGRDGFAQLMLTAEISGNDDLRDLLSPDHKDLQLTVFTDYLSSKEIRAFGDRVTSLAQTLLPPGASAEVTGTPLLWANMDHHLLLSQSTILISVVLPLALIMLLIVRSLPLLLIGLTVNLLPVGLILGLMAWMGVKINMATVLIGGITMGIAVDDTIHFLWRFRSEIRRGKSFTDALANTYQHTGTAIFMTAVVLSCGFLVMALSDFYPTADFGKLTSLTIVIAFVAEIFLMPTLLVLWERTRARLRGGITLPMPGDVSGRND
jgi:uncharacterized protein